MKMAIDSPKNDFAEKHRFLTYADEPDTVYDGSKILDGSVTTDKIADYAVTTDKIDDESITLGKMDDDVQNLLEGNVKGFNTVSDMQAATLEVGDICHTDGYEVSGDGEDAWYEVRIDGTADNEQIIELQDGLFAHRVVYNNRKIYSVSRNVKINLQKVETTQLHSAFTLAGVYAQGATTDGTYIYVYAIPLSGSTSTPRLYKLNDSFEIVDTLVFNEESPGHGNSLYYDSVLDSVVIVSGNRVCTRVSRDLATTSSITNLTSVYISEFCANSTIGIANIRGTNQFLFYNRHGNGIFTAFGTANYDLERGAAYNYLQGCFMSSNCFYAMVSSSRFGTSLACIGFNGAYICNYTDANITKEMQDAFILGTDVYFIESYGDIYKTTLSSVTPSLERMSTQPTSNIVPWLNYNFVSGPIGVDVSDVFKFASVSYDGTNSVQFMVTAPNYKHFDGSTSTLDAPVFRWADFRGVLRTTRVSNGSYRIYGALPDGTFMHIVYTASDSIQYLSRIYIYGLNGTRYDSGAMTQSTSYQTKLAELWTNNIVPLPVWGGLKNNRIVFDGFENQPALPSNYGLFCV